MCDRYDAAGEDNHPDLEDEFLCEYVDGTMDPIVREVFEEYVRANPDLRDHIECLQHTRLLLCRYGCRCHAPGDLHDRLRREITCDLIHGRVPFHVLVSDRLRGVSSVSSAMALLVLIAVLGGVTVVDAGHRSAALTSAAVITVQDVRPAMSPTRAVSAAPRMPRYSPREYDRAMLRTGRSLVAAGLERDLGAQAAYAANLGRLPAFP